MRTHFRNKLSSLLLLGVILTNTALAEDVKPLKKGDVFSVCGLVFMGVGMLAGAIASGGAVGGVLSRQQGFFESRQAYEQRQEENRKREQPFVIVSIASLGTGAFLFVGGYIFSVFSSKSATTRPDVPPYATITIKDLPEGATAKIDSQEIEVQNQSIAVSIEYTTEKTATLDSILEITTIDGKSEFYKLQVMIAPGSNITVPYILFARQMDAE